MSRSLLGFGSARAVRPVILERDTPRSFAALEDDTYGVGVPT